MMVMSGSIASISRVGNLKLTDVIVLAVGKENRSPSSASGCDATQVDGLRRRWRDAT